MCIKKRYSVLCRPSAVNTEFHFILCGLIVWKVYYESPTSRNTVTNGFLQPVRSQIFKNLCLHKNLQDRSSCVSDLLLYDVTESEEKNVTFASVMCQKLVELRVLYKWFSQQISINSASVTWRQCDKIFDIYLCNSLDEGILCSLQFAQTSLENLFSSSITTMNEAYFHRYQCACVQCTCKWSCISVCANEMHLFTIL